jgi:crossover junction endonuclease MUS81
LWIASEIVDSVPGELRLPDSREIVLEYVIERKKMDDLSGSIMDGRFHEQKFRMKQCGVANCIYLVEEFETMTHCRLPQRSLQQAITNTFVMDEFHVKQTKDLKESIAYLTIMTRQLQKHYSNKTIRAYSVDVHEKLLGSSSRSDSSIVNGISFGKFNDVSLKNKVFTNSEMFARQLIAIPNSSAEKAHAIINIYPTIASLHEAYEECSTDKQRQELLSSLRLASQNRLDLFKLL